MSTQWEPQQNNNGASGQEPQYGTGRPEQQGQQWQAQQGQQWPGEQGQQWQGQQYPNQQQYSAAPYQSQQQWNPNPTGYAAPPVRRSGVLGAVSLAIVVLATAAVSILAWMLGGGLGDFLLQVSAAPGSFNEADLANDPRVAAYVESAAGMFGALGLACVAGLVGWIMSIVATATNRGRVMGIVGIVVGVLALPIGYAVGMFALTPILAQLGS